MTKIQVNREGDWAAVMRGNLTGSKDPGDQNRETQEGKARMIIGRPSRVGAPGLQSLVCALLATACSPQTTPAHQTGTPETAIRNEAELRKISHLRQSPERVRELKGMAAKGDVEAMHGLFAHHITAGETKEARFWLGEAVRHGDCHSVQIFEETYLEVPPRELAHWRNEGRKLGCDPKKDYLGIFDKRR